MGRGAHRGRGGAWERLGSHLGFASTRPEQEYGTGPDDLWVHRRRPACRDRVEDRLYHRLIAKHDLDQLGGSVRWDQEHYPGLTPVPVMVHPSREYDEHGTAVPDMRVVTPIKLEQLKRAVKEYAVALADGQGRWSDEQAVAAQLAHHKLDAGNLFQTYGEAGWAAR